MRKILAISLVLLFVCATAAVAREVNKPVPMLYDESIVARGRTTSGIFGVSQSVDTYYFGGTEIVGGEAVASIPDGGGWWPYGKRWTWSSAGYNSVPHSGLPMDGWKQIDATGIRVEDDYFRTMDDATLGQACVITGSRSLFCGATNQECIDLCFLTTEGTGYANGWAQKVATPTYNYAGTEQILLEFAYYVETERNYDFCYVILERWDTAISKWVEVEVMATYDGPGIDGNAKLDIDKALMGLPVPIDFRIVFSFVADGGYSDADGMFATTCGAWAIDNYSLKDGASTDAVDFESVPVGQLPSGWSRVFGGCGAYSSVQHVDDLDYSIEQDACVDALAEYEWCLMADSVITFYDVNASSYPLHPWCQDEYIVSPKIPLSGDETHPYGGLPGRIVFYECFGNLAVAEHVFFYWQAAYQPGCASGGWSPWVSDNYVWYTGVGARCRQYFTDMSAYIPPTADSMKMCFGVVNLCDETPWGGQCLESDNQTPYFDNVAVGAYGNVATPYVDMRELDAWQDQFPEDGTLNPLSTADTRVSNYLSDFEPPIFGDSLTCRGAAEDMEVWYYFRIAKTGPRQEAIAGWSDWLDKFPTEDGWYYARMDTAEMTIYDSLSAPIGTVPVFQNYMCTFHEEDGNFTVEGEEILPNQFFTPGTKVEWFLRACYEAASDSFYLFTPLAPEEFEVLPGMVPAGESVEWPCLIYVDHFGQRGNWGVRNATYTQDALNAAGLPFDMYNKYGPTSDLRNGIARYDVNLGQTGSIGDPDFCWGPGATTNQFVAYSHCLLNAGNVGQYSIDDPDQAMLEQWLTVYSDADFTRFLWISGDSWAEYVPNAWLGLLEVSVISSNYYAREADYTYCLPMNGMPGGTLVCGVPEEDPEDFILRSNACTRGYTVLERRSPGSEAVNEIEYYADLNATESVAAISNQTTGNYYWTFAEGYDYCAIRDADGTPMTPYGCGEAWTYISDWIECVMTTWGLYTTGSICSPASLIGVEPGTTPPAVVTSLGQAFPNPMNPTATIKFSIGKPGKVTLRVFDVSGRVIRTLVDEAKVIGEYSVMWDGRSDGGDRVASGVFFYQLDAPGHQSAKKIVILQ